MPGKLQTPGISRDISGEIVKRGEKLKPGKSREQTIVSKLLHGQFAQMRFSHLLFAQAEKFTLAEALREAEAEMEVRCFL